MAENESVIAIFTTHHDAEDAVKELQKSGFDMKQLSIVGKDYHTEEHVIGYYNTGERVASWGKAGAFWGWIWGLVFGSALVFIPGIGAVMVGGPLVSWLAAALETAIVVGGLSAIGAALVSVGIPKDSVLKYETALKANKFVLIAHGTSEEVKRAQAVLDANKAEESTVHKELVAQSSATK